MTWLVTQLIQITYAQKADGSLTPPFHLPAIRLPIVQMSSRSRWSPTTALRSVASDRLSLHPSSSPSRPYYPGASQRRTCPITRLRLVRVLEWGHERRLRNIDAPEAGRSSCPAARWLYRPTPRKSRCTRGRTSRTSSGAFRGCIGVSFTE